MNNKQIILIVDDTLDNLRILGDLLCEEYEVHVATNGIDAISIVKSLSPDIILLDIMMPGLDGFEVCRQLKASSEYQMIPIIFISSLDMPEQKVRAFQEGGVDYITKPFQTDEVQARVRTHIQLSKMEALKREISERERAEESLKEKNALLEEQQEEYITLNDVLRKTNNFLEIEKIRAEESDRLKTVFLQNMSHEIRTPLNAIIGFSDLLSDDDIEPQDRDEFVNIIKKRSKDLLNLISNLLEFSKIESDSIDVNISSLDIEKFILDIFVENKSNPILLKNNELTFIYEINLFGISTQIQTDQFRLRQIINILLDNAFKFTEKGVIELGCKINDGDIEFYVKDSGIGIPSNKHEMVFDRFRQVEETTYRKYEGSGLGLAIAKGLADLLRINIRLESESGSGSTFYLSSPLNNSK